MRNSITVQSRRIWAICLALTVAFLYAPIIFSADPMMMEQTTNQFAGAKVNKGTVTLSHKDGKHILTLSDDFVDPATPDPHWQVVDSKGNVYLLHKLSIKGEKYNKSIVLPSYVPGVAKVQIWCSFAETLLGEASFKEPMMFGMMK